MSEKLRREKDILRRATSTYLEATTSEYSKYLEGSPTFVTFYSLIAPASTQDIGLEAVNDIIGKNSPKKYKKINDCVIYGVDAMDINNELNERGLVSNISGEFIMIPDTVRPYPNDFFVFDYEGMETQLFRITDVQFDRATVEKYFRCSYVLYPDNADEIFNNVDEDYTLIFDNIGTGSNSLLESDKATQISRCQELQDSMIERFITNFYDEENDQFVYIDPNSGYRYWNPYAQRFIHETGCLRKNGKELLTEFYFTDVNEMKYPGVFSEWTYMKSLYKALITKNNNITVPMSFVELKDGEDLPERKNLPFINSPYKYKYLQPIPYIQNSDIADCTNGYLFLLDPMLQNPKFAYMYNGHKNKVHKLDELHVSAIISNISDRDMVYECSRNEIEATKICQAFDDGDSFELVDASLKGMYENIDKKYERDLLVDIILGWLAGTLTLTDDLLSKLNEYYYQVNAKNFYLLPMVLYVLKQLS